MNREWVKELIRCTLASPFNKCQFKTLQETNPINPKLIRTRAKKYPNEPKKSQKLTKMAIFIPTYRTERGQWGKNGAIKGQMRQKIIND